MAGIDIKAHDVRFVEDNWESPVLFLFILSLLTWSFKVHLCKVLPGVDVC